MSMNQFKTHFVRRGARRRTAPRAHLAVETLEARWVLSQLNSVNLPGHHELPPLVSHSSGGEHSGYMGPSGLQPISQPTPNQGYQGQTTKLNITVPDGTTVSSLSDGTQTASISPSGVAGTVPTTWLSWSSPLDAESSTPRVLTFINVSSATIQLSTPVLTFGVEVEPNQFTPAFTVNATFMDDMGGILGVIPREVIGRAGARLFGATVVSGNPISSVRLDISPDAQGFAIAQVRYSFKTFALAGPYVMSSTPTGDVRPPLDHVSVTFNTPMNPDTFTPDQVSLTAPDGSSVKPGKIVANPDDTQFTITFDSQSALGQYTLAIGPNIEDQAGNAMDQDFDGIPGEPTDTYTATFSGALLFNGGFETGDFTGWTQSGDLGFTSVGTGMPHSGRFAADLGPLNEGFLAQTFPTTPGASYTLDYWLKNDGGTPNSFRAMIDGVNIPDSVLTNAAAMPYTEFTFGFTAAGNTTELKFGFVQVPAYWHLDDVSVTPADGAAVAGHPHPAILDAAAALPGGSTLTAPVAAPAAASPALLLRSDKPVASPAAAVRQDTASTDAFFAATNRSDSLMAPALSIGDDSARTDSSRLALWVPEAI